MDDDTPAWAKRSAQAPGRRRRQVVAGLGVLLEVDAADLGVAGDAEAHEGVQRLADEPGDDEGVRQDRERPDRLGLELVEPAAVEQPVDRGRRLCSGEEADRERADETADEVDSDDVERVVEAEPELQAHGIRAGHAGEQTDDQGAPTGLTDEHDGVIATRPATIPEAAPSEVAWPSRTRSVSSQPAIAATGRAERVDPGDRGRGVAEIADPELNPNQPNHSNPAPIMTRVRLCGRIASLPKPSRLPSTRASARPAAPALMWIAVPPAKSIALMLLAIQPPFSDGEAVEREDPVRHWEVDERGPHDGEDDPGRELRPVGDRPGDQCDGDDREDRLEGHVRHRRNGPCDRVRRHEPGQPEVLGRVSHEPEAHRPSCRTPCCTPTAPR